MKKLDQKDLLLSPKVVTDLTGSGTDDPNATKDTNTCTETAVDCTGASDDGTCLTLEEEGCATKKCATKECLTIVETCICTKLCNETHSQDVQCCKPTEQIDSRCCITPPVSANYCEESDIIFCPVSNVCEETEVCVTPDVTESCLNC